MITVYGTPGTGPGGGRSQVEMGDDAGIRVQWVSNEFEARGKSFGVTDGFRPDGVEADYWIDVAVKTSTKSFNQWYAIGQHKRKNGPYAAPVGRSDHAKTAFSTGAVDCSVKAEDFALRHELMAQVGMEQTDSTETWHFAIRSNPAPWWDRTKVKSPVDKTPKPTPTAVKNPNLLKENEMAYLVVENDTAKPRIFAMLETGAIHLQSTDEVNSYLEHFAGLGLTGDGFSKAMPKSSKSITLISESKEKQFKKVLAMK